MSGATEEPCEEYDGIAFDFDDSDTEEDSCTPNDVDLPEVEVSSDKEEEGDIFEGECVSLGSCVLTAPSDLDVSRIAY